MGEPLIERVRHAAAVAKIELDYNVIENPLNPIFDKKTIKSFPYSARDGFRLVLASNHLVFAFVEQPACPVQCTCLVLCGSRRSAG